MDIGLFQIFTNNVTDILVYTYLLACALMLHIYLRMELLGHREYICSALVDIAKTVFHSGGSVLQSY